MSSTDSTGNTSICLV